MKDSGTVSSRTLPSPVTSFFLITAFLVLLGFPARSFSTPISLEGNGGWVNGQGFVPPPSLEGKVVLYDFWDYTCINCIRTFPHLEEIYRKYKGKGLVIVGIHSPEFDFAARPERIERAIWQYHINFPVVLDKDQTLWRRFKNHYWPSDYLYSPDGTLLYHSIGEGGYDELEDSIVSALHLPARLSGTTDSTGFSPDLTPELYAGTDRGHLGNPSGFHPAEYFYSGHISINNSIILSGLWSSTPDHIFSGISKDNHPPTLTIYYEGRGVNAVMRRPKNQPEGIVLVSVDGYPLSKNEAGSDITIDPKSGALVRVNHSRMYVLVNGQPYGPHRLDLVFLTPGTSLYTLTFNP
ncbi:MAG: thioredoxin-like domain-containing protein [Leptospirillia bacterium]